MSTAFSVFVRSKLYCFNKVLHLETDFSTHSTIKEIKNCREGQSVSFVSQETILSSRTLLSFGKISLHFSLHLCVIFLHCTVRQCPEILIYVFKARSHLGISLLLTFYLLTINNHHFLLFFTLFNVYFLIPTTITTRRNTGSHTITDVE